MAFSLSRRAALAGYRLVPFDTIGSTSDEALARARAGEGGQLWLVAPEQTAGRGRRGNVWQTARGNLAASLLLVTTVEPSVVAQLGFVAGVALVEALDSVRAGTEGRGTAAFELKWPNDVLAEGRKIAGILLQTESLPHGRRAAVIGIGVNVSQAPESVAYPTASLDALGVETTAEKLFAALSETWLAAFDLWDEGRGFLAVREAWLSRAAGLSGEVRVQFRDDLLEGRFETIDELGQLVLRVGDGSLRHVSAGEVHFGSAAGTGPRIGVRP